MDIDVAVPVAAVRLFCPEGTSVVHGVLPPLVTCRKMDLEVGLV
jgi:hypothetical protein